MAFRILSVNLDDVFNEEASLTVVVQPAGRTLPITIRIGPDGISASDDLGSADWKLVPAKTLTALADRIIEESEFASDHPPTSERLAQIAYDLRHP